MFADQTIVERIKNIVVGLEQKMSLRGSGGELLRGAVTNYIQNLSDAHFPCHDDNVVDLWKMILGKIINVFDCCTAILKIAFAHLNFHQSLDDFYSSPLTVKAFIIIVQ
jgi:hypothetical protein